MKKKIVLFLTVVLIAAMALPQIAWAEHKEENTYRFPTGILPYAAQMEDETSVRVSWNRFTYCKAYILSWKKTGSDEAAQSVRIDDPKTDTYVVTGLEPETDYHFSIKGVLTDAQGRDLFTESYSIEGATYIKTPEYTHCYIDGSCITTNWRVQESYSKLHIYRAESKDGSYQQVKTLDAGGSYADDLYSFREDTQYVRFHFYDSNVKKGKTYYYKAQAEGAIGDKTYLSAFSKPVKLAAKNEAGRFTTKLLNKRKSYTKKIVIKVTSDKANYTTYLKNFTKLIYAKNGKVGRRNVVKAEYSRNGKKYYKLKNKNVAIKAGQSFYLRVTTKSRLWISKTGEECSIFISARYARPAYTGTDKVSLRMDPITYGANILADKSFERYPDPFYDHQNSIGTNAVLEGKKMSASSVMLYWNSAGYKNYAIRYGTTKASVAPLQGEPIIVPEYQVELLIDGLKKGKTYYFSIIPCSYGNDSEQYEVEEDNFGLKWDGKTFTKFRFKV